MSGGKKKVFLASGAAPKVIEEFFARGESTQVSDQSEAEWLILRVGDCVPKEFIFSWARNGYSLYRREPLRQSIW